MLSSCIHFKLSRICKWVSFATLQKPLAPLTEQQWAVTRPAPWSSLPWCGCSGVKGSGFCNSSCCFLPKMGQQGWGGGGLV